MFQSFFDRAKHAVRDATDKVKTKAAGVAQLLGPSKPLPGEKSYLVNPSKFILSMKKKVPLYLMKCPVENVEVTYSGQSDIVKTSNFLNSRFGDRYLIINVSDVPYDYKMFNGSVEEFFFNGYPAPPVKVLVQICVAVENWLGEQEAQQRLQESKVAQESPSTRSKKRKKKTSKRDGPAVLVHCKTGKGRTAVVMACLLVSSNLHHSFFSVCLTTRLTMLQAWLQLSDSPVEALNYVSSRLAMPVEMVTIPSQRRYVEYVDTLYSRAAALIYLPLFDVLGFFLLATDTSPTF